MARINHIVGICLVVGLAGAVGVVIGMRASPEAARSSSTSSNHSPEPARASNDEGREELARTRARLAALEKEIDKVRTRSEAATRGKVEEEPSTDVAPLPPDTPEEEAFPYNQVFDEDQVDNGAEARRIERSMTARMDEIEGLLLKQGECRRGSCFFMLQATASDSRSFADIMKDLAITMPAVAEDRFATMIPFPSESGVMDTIKVYIKRDRS